jgi:hypothetical protein
LYFHLIEGSVRFKDFSLGCREMHQKRGDPSFQNFGLDIVCTTGGSIESDNLKEKAHCFDSKSEFREIEGQWLAIPTTLHLFECPPRWD